MDSEPAVECLCEITRDEVKVDRRSYGQRFRALSRLSYSLQIGEAGGIRTHDHGFLRPCTPSRQSIHFHLSRAVALLLGSSVLARIRTWSSTFAESRAIHHTPRT